MKRSLSKITVIGVLLFSSVSLAFAQLDVGEILDGFEGTGGSLSGFIIMTFINLGAAICMVLLQMGLI